MAVILFAHTALFRSFAFAHSVEGNGKLISDLGHLQEFTVVFTSRLEQIFTGRNAVPHILAVD